MKYVHAYADLLTFHNAPTVHHYYQ